MISEEASKLNAEYDGRKPGSLEIFLEYMGLTEDEFNQIVGKMTIPPFEPNYSNISDADQVWDFEEWYREDNRKKNMIGIIDYGAGNLASVQNALEHLGHDACVFRDPDAIQDFDRIILPGVGSFRVAMDCL